MTRNRLAIFDIDGTLTDSVAIHQSGFIQALNKFGLYDFDTNWSSYTHHTDSYIFKTILEAQLKRPVSAEDIAQFEDLLHELIATALEHHPLQEIEGARLFLSAMQHHSDFDIVLATGSLLKPARLKLEKTGIAIPDALVITANNIWSRDELVLRAITRAKEHYGAADYVQIISFGDGFWDYETSKNINIDFVGINNQLLQSHNISPFYHNYHDHALLKMLGMDQLPAEYLDFDLSLRE